MAALFDGGRLLALFPGQGSQAEGMAEPLWEYPVARQTFAEASELLGWDIGDLCRFGSMAELTRTDRTQLAVLCSSVATWRVLAEAGASFAVAAGHSLGEYSALVAAGMLSFEDALRVVDARGRAMQACAERKPGTMAAVIGLEDAAVEEICAAIPEVWVANYNSPGQVVISGASQGVGAAAEAALARGAKRVIPLPVAGAFHTPFMAEAAEALAEALARAEFKPGDGMFFSTTEMRVPKPEELPAVLARQLTSPVRFTQSMRMILQGGSVPTLPGEPAPQAAIEVGPGNVLTGLMKRIARDFPVTGTGDREALQAVLSELARL